MRKNAFNSKEATKAINQFRIAINGAKFTKEQVLTMFKENKIPTNRSFWAALNKSKIFKKVGKDEFVFASGQPVYYGVIDKVYREYSELMKGYYKKHTERVKAEPKENFDPKGELNAMKKFAIDFLKDLGYQILEPVGIVYQSI